MANNVRCAIQTIHIHIMVFRIIAYDHHMCSCIYKHARHSIVSFYKHVYIWWMLFLPIWCIWWYDSEAWNSRTIPLLYILSATYCDLWAPIYIYAMPKRPAATDTHCSKWFVAKLYLICCDVSINLYSCDIGNSWCCIFVPGAVVCVIGIQLSLYHHQLKYF